jgi:hypothetical protein
MVQTTKSTSPNKSNAFRNYSAFSGTAEKDSGSANTNNVRPGDMGIGTYPRHG